MVEQGSTNLVCGGEFGKGDILVPDNEELGNLDASESHARRINAKEVITPKNGEHFMFPIADGTVKSLDIMADDSEARNDFRSIEGKYIERHHVEPRVKLCVPNEDSFQIPLRYICKHICAF